MKVFHSTKNKEFEPKKKILKVLSQNDYIFAVNEPLINFRYINDCVKLNKYPEYLVIDNPTLIELNNQSGGSGNKNNAYSNTNASYDMNLSTTDINLSSLGSFQKAKQGEKYD